MKFEELENIKNLLRTANILSTLSEKYQEEIKDSKCDKHDFGFGGDNRFAIFSFTVCLCGYTGYYGNSGCSTLATVDNREASRFLHKYLNKNRDRILSEMAEYARAEAAEKRDKAMAELESALNLINSLEEIKD